MKQSKPILEVRDLLKTFGAVVAAKDINVDVNRGEIVGIIGANGAGKTCFVNMVTVGYCMDVIIIIYFITNKTENQCYDVHIYSCL